MSSFWSVWIIVLTTATLVGVLALLLSNRKINRQDGSQTGEGRKPAMSTMALKNMTTRCLRGG